MSRQLIQGSKSNSLDQAPILYSLQHCPYAMRARIALFKSHKTVLIRAVKLNNKPKEMLVASPKGSVPILVVSDRIILEESLEVMLWALAENDPDDLLDYKQETALTRMHALISRFEHEFVPALEAYSCAKRYHEDNLGECRRRCEVVLQALEDRLTQHTYLFSDRESLLDIAVMPFIRKFARIERQWYLQSPYPKLRDWLNGYLQSAMFAKVMAKHELWLENRQDIYFGYSKSKKS
ncbi:glutathione S-transferase [Vibrio genomosp. F10]|uniref:glutathione S-transferase n=1 Tax=Vibrio genomosp. F10 TaxID=723171 RepID=UPI0002DB9AA7|nr:glutathione S-transferase [Vibrio genomosp. F10]OEF05503.1 glutathione S-transferase [Vibrio genomosp. F10 str. 9ZB36]